jgi:hypothetical protein
LGDPGCSFDRLSFDISLVELCLIALLLAASCFSQSLTANRIMCRQDGNGHQAMSHEKTS